MPPSIGGTSVDNRRSTSVTEDSVFSRYLTGAALKRFGEVAFIQIINRRHVAAHGLSPSLKAP